MNTIRVEDGLVTYRNTFPGGPAAFFADLTQQTFIINNILYVLQTLLADGVVIYRCYVVWQSVWIIVLPSILWCGVAVTGICAIYSFFQVTSNSGNPYANEIGQPEQLITAYFALTMATNLLSSGLLAYRIWMIEHSASTIRSKKDTMMPIVRVVIDSCVLYSVVLFIALICFVCSNNGELVIVDMLIPTISIAFYMILIRVAINRKHHVHSSIIGMASEMEQDNLQKRPMQFLQFHISQFTHDDSTAVHASRTGDEVLDSER